MFGNDTVHSGSSTPANMPGSARGGFGRAVRRRAGQAMTIGGVATLAWAALATVPHGALIEAHASTGPPCGANELCIKQSQVPTTAVAFSGGTGCSGLVSQNPSEDLWHFVIPDGASFDTDTSHFTAIFTGPDGQIHADSIGGPGDKMAYVYSPAGATLTWAFATNVSGTATQGYFVLSSTCPASQSSSSSTTSSTSTSSTTTTSTTATGSVSGTHTSSSSSPDGSHPSGGTAGIAVPNTGAGEASLLGVALLIGGAVSLEAVRSRGRR